MFFRQKYDTFIRIYDDIGYIVNKSNFSDRVVDASGMIFLKSLSRTPRTLDDIIQEIAEKFVGVTPVDIRQDAVDFFATLEEAGFIISGENKAKLDRKDTRFSNGHLSSTAINSKIIKTNISSDIQQEEKSTRQFLEEHFKGKPRLTSLQVELTSRCNERCVHCYIPRKNKPCDIDTVLFYKLLDQCGEIGLLDIGLSGGEPLLHKNFCDFLYKANDHDLSIKVLSNLTLLTDKIIKTMKAVSVCTVQASLYSLEPSIHDAITLQPGSCEKTKEGVARLVEAAIPVLIVCPIMKQNKDSFAGVLRWSQNIGVPSGAFPQIIARSDHSTGNLENRISIDEDIQVISDILENAPGVYGDERFNPNYHTPGMHPCLQDLCKSTLCVNSAGDVLPNPAWNNVLGNLHKQPLQDIWENSAEIKRIRNIGINDFPQCQACPDIQFCTMSLHGNANENLKGDPFIIPLYICEHARQSRKLVWAWRQTRKNQEGETNALPSEI